MKIKFLTGFSCFGGSTIALIEHCRLLDSVGYNVELYGDCDWHLSNYSKSKRMSELVIDPDDILVCHLIEMKTRPNCKKCFLYVHECEVFDLKSKDIAGYDQIIFLNEKQKFFHGREGIIIPNPMSNLVDKSNNNPPNKNIAGIVGTIQTRKQQKISILKAIEDGASKVLLFGDKEEEYYKKEIEPLLSERVEYKGYYEPTNRMEMYNQFDTLYHFSSDESASLVLGECKILGKPIVKSDCVIDYDITDDKEIISKWKTIISEKVNKLVCVVTYNRKDCIEKWLRAWNNAEKFDAKIAVLHACDEGDVKEDEKENILKHNPDFYIPFKNTELRDLQALIKVVRGEFAIPDFDYLFWFTDDMLPMRKSFLKPFVEKIQKPNVGLVAQCYEPKSISGADAHVRTVAYGITKQVSENLQFPEVGPTDQRPYYFEFGKKNIFENHLLNQVIGMGKDFELCHSEVGDDYAHWTSFLDWMWDCHLLGHWKEYEKIYENQFCEVQKFEDIKTRRETLLTMEECEELTLVPNKICAIIPTSTAPVEFLVWSVFSLLLRSDPNKLEHFIVAINGPDIRTGDPHLQNLKQKFIEDLRSIKWRDRDMPVTLIRTWSRIGHAQTIEQCIPWAHTEFYVSMHDDIIILDDKWCDSIDDFKDANLICKTYGPAIHQKLNGTNYLLGLPHFNSIFTLCKKSRMKAINANWIGYHVPLEFQIDNLWNFDDFIDWYRRHDIVCENNIPKKQNKYSVLSIDIGGSFIPEIMNKKYKLTEFNADSIKHFVSISWGDENRKNKILETVQKEVVALERKIIQNESFWNIYKKYVKPNIERKCF